MIRHTDNFLQDNVRFHSTELRLNRYRSTQIIKECLKNNEKELEDTEGYLKQESTPSELNFDD